MKRLVLILLFLSLLNACQIIGLTNDYNKLNNTQKEHILPFKSFTEAETGKIYKINGPQIKEEISKYPKALVYVFANGCSSQNCMPMMHYEDYAKKNGYKLFMVMTGYGMLDKTIKQSFESPLYVINNEYYNSKYTHIFTRNFTNELLGIPIKSKYRERAIDGSLFFYNYGILDTVLWKLPERKTVFLP